MPEHSSSVAAPQRGILRWLGDFLRAAFGMILPRRMKDPLRTHDEVFESLDIKAIQAELQLAEQARRYGEVELPDSGDAQLDGPQESVRQRVLEDVRGAYRRANREKERLLDALRARNVESLVERALSLPAQRIEEMWVERRDIRHKIDLLSAQRIEINDRLRSYRERYAITRGPSLKEDYERKLIIAATAILAIIQAIANSLLFAQGMDRGISQAWLLAAILGALDIAWHYSVARVGTRVHGHRWYERVPGGLAVLLLLATMPIYNLSLVHLRLGIQQAGFSEGMQTWLSALRANPFGFSDFTSVILLAIGLLCSSLAVLAAWQWDEVIPEYRSLATKLRDTDGSLGYWRDRDDRMALDAIDDAAEALSRIRDEIEHNGLVAKAIVGRMERLAENLESFLAGADTAFAAMIRFYRDENRLARNTAPPEYFSQPVSLAAQPPTDLGLSEFRAILEEQDRCRQKLGALPPDLREHFRAVIDEGPQMEDLG